VTEEEKKDSPIQITEAAAKRILELINSQNPKPAGLRVGVIGGGCSGFSYGLQFENEAGQMDKTFRFNERGEPDKDNGKLLIFVDATSFMYLNGVKIDFVETTMGVGFKFENPNVKSTCGCGSSFST